MRVLISGAGIAGPSLAWFLSKAGARITMVERAPALLPHGQNIDIAGSAISVVKRMGLLDEVRRLNTGEKGSKFIDPQGRPFAPFPLNPEAPASLTSEFEILRGDLAMVLHRATKNNPNVNTIYGTTIEEVVSNNDKSVKVKLSNGDVQEYDMLVAADGMRSHTRRQCFAPESVKMIDKNMYAMYCTLPRIPSDDDWWNIYQALGSRIITLRPDPHGTIRAMFTIVPRNESQKQAWQKASRSDRTTQEKLLRSEFSDAGWQVQRLLGAMSDADDFYFQPIQQVKMDSWSTSRVVCLGDAAYAPSPLTGKGSSLAITGAYVLAGELSKLSAGEHPLQAFKAFEKTFRPYVEETQEIPSALPGAAHPQKEWQRTLFRGFLRTLSTIVQLQPVKSRIKKEHEDEFPLPHYPSFETATT